MFSPLKICSFNVRYDNSYDRHSWRDRRPFVCEFVKSNNFEIVGFQEPLAHQVADLEKGLPGYSWVGGGRDDGAGCGEFSPIFYRKDRFRLIRSGTLWLSETPLQPSVAWSASFPRIVTFAKLIDTQSGSGEPLFFLSCHFDHMSACARANSAKLCVEFLQGFANEILEEYKLGRSPLLIMVGDLNSAPSDTPVRTLDCCELFSGLEPFEIKMVSARRVAEVRPADDSMGTFHSFSGHQRCESIDHVFVSDCVKVKKFEIASEYHGTARSGEWIWPSDHFPIVVHLESALPLTAATRPSLSASASSTYSTHLQTQLMSTSPSASCGGAITCATFNIKQYMPNVDWKERCKTFVGFVKSKKLDIFCLQEPDYSQIQDIALSLPHLDWIGGGRDDGLRSGEFCPIFFSRKKFEVFRSGTLWLSETPLRPSVGWDASLPRIVTFVTLLDRTTNVRMAVLSTHFDHRGPKSRSHSAKFVSGFADSLISELMSIPQIGSGTAAVSGSRSPPPAVAAILGGSFNFNSDSEEHKTITSTMLRNSRKISESKTGPESTFVLKTDRGERTESSVDFLFVGQQSVQPRVLSHEIVTVLDRVSTHRPIVADVLFC